MRTLPAAEVWAAQNPEHQGSPWAGLGYSYCEAFVHLAGGFTQTFPSARAAALASGPLDQNIDNLQVGEIVYFSGGASDFGHDGYWTERGFLCVSQASGVQVGGGIVYVPSVRDYMRQRPYLHLLGHTFRHGTEKLADITPSGGGVTPLKKRRKENMPTIIVAPNNSCAYVVVRPDGGTGKAQITNPQVIANEAAFGNFPASVSQDTYDSYATL